MYNHVMFWSMLILGVVPGAVFCEEQDGTQAVLVKINPIISRSKRIIQFSGRYKRNGPEKSSLFLEFPESFFKDPKLKRLYSSLVGERRSGRNATPEKTNLVFQIDPAAFGEQTARAPKKRDVRDETAAFELKIAPPAAKVKQMGRGLTGFVPRHETTKNWCIERMMGSEPILEPTDRNNLEPSSEIVSETMCYPSKPSTQVMRICGSVTTPAHHTEMHDPCRCQSQDEQPQIETSTSMYTQCKSTDPVLTHHMENICFTTERCSPKATFAPYAVDVFSTTYKPTATKPSCPPSSTACPSIFQRLRRRRQKESPLKNFFVLSNSPQNCPPFCPPSCTTSKPTDCSTSSNSDVCQITTTCPTATTCQTTTTCKTTTCKTTKCEFSTTCPPSSTTCSTTTNNYCCPKVKRARHDDPLRNVLRVFRQRHPRSTNRKASFDVAVHPKRFRRNPIPPKRRERTLLVYRPKRGLRKVNFRPRVWLK